MRVQAETRIELGTNREADHILLKGVLRDDLGEAIAGARVDVRLAEAQSRRTVLSRDVVTDDRGRFAVAAAVTTGDYELRAIFEGGDYYQRTEVSRTIDLNRADVRLGVEVPHHGELDLDLPSHEIEVHASCELGASGIDVALLDEMGRTLATGRTGPDERALFEIPSSALGEPGAGRLVARSRADDARAQAQTEVPIVRYRRMVLSLTASPTRVARGGEVHLSGALVDSQSALPGRAIGLFADGDRHLTTVLTDGEGAYAADVSFEQEEAGSIAVVARFESDAPGRDTIESEPVTLSIDAPNPMSWLWAALPITICILLLMLIARRAPQRLTAVPPPPPPAPSGVSAAIRSSRWPAHAAIGGKVVDQLRGTPIAGARVSLSWQDGEEVSHRVTDEEGRFSFDEPRIGDHRLSVTARGYGREESEVSSPHRGEWGALTVRLESLRERILGAYRKVAIALLPSARLWEIWTNREILEHGKAKGRSPELAQLTHRVEEGFYSSEGPSEQDVSAVEREAESAYAALARDPGTRRPDGGDEGEPTPR